MPDGGCRQAEDGAWREGLLDGGKKVRHFAMQTSELLTGNIGTFCGNVPHFLQPPSKEKNEKNEGSA